ncbi:MAG TPA: hypothetical protein VH599_04865 [Ktedonobacterales bacterium]
MPPDYVLPVLIALCVFLGAWYFVGVWLNRARGIRLARTLRERLLAMEAEDLSGRWVNASIFQFVGQRAAAPIGKLAAVIVLESRELALIWLVNLLRGRRDLLVIRLELRSAPKAGVELEAHRSQSKPERDVRPRITEPGWEQTTINGYTLHYQAGAARLVATLTPLLHEWQSQMIRLSISASSPHLLLSLSPAPAVLAAENTFAAVRKLAEAITKRS